MHYKIYWEPEFGFKQTSVMWRSKIDVYGDSKIRWNRKLAEQSYIKNVYIFLKKVPSINKKLINDFVSSVISVHHS